MTDDALLRALGEGLLDTLLDPPRRGDPVVRYADAARLRSLFAESVGLELAEHEPSHPAARLEAAAESVLRWSVRTRHPRFVNQNFAGADPVAVLGDWLGALLNTTNATYEAAPVFTLMERAVIDKLARLAGFPNTTSDDDVPAGIFSPGGSTATLYALQLARHRRNPDVIRTGASGRPAALFASEAAHYSVHKSAALLGLGTDAVETVPTDRDGAIRVDLFDLAVAEALAEGREPLAAVATAGTTVTGAFDDLVAMADVCERRGVWLHVDGAYGASALFSPAHRKLLAGVDRADSLVWDLHKMMGMTQQCSVLLVRDPLQLETCFGAGADYLFQPDKRNAHLDSGDRTFQCGRRVDALKLWLAWKHHGDDGFAARIDHAVGVADHVRRRIADSDGRFAAVVPGHFTNVCLLWVPPALRPFAPESLDRGRRERLHRLAPRVKARMQDEGTALVGFQPVHGINAFRLLFMNPAVTTDDGDALLDLIDRYASEEWDS